MAIARDQGISIEEIIDDRCILAEDQSQKLPAQQVLNDGKDFAAKFFEDGLQIVKDLFACHQTARISCHHSAHKAVILRANNSGRQPRMWKINSSILRSPIMPERSR